jgi:hypothetical protein
MVSGVMNSRAAAVITTLASAPRSRKRRARSALLYAAMLPHIPNKIRRWLSMKAVLNRQNMRYYALPAWLCNPPLWSVKRSLTRGAKLRLAFLAASFERRASLYFSPGRNYYP